MEDTKKIKGLIFDMGDILFDATIWRKWLYKKLQAFGIAISFNELFMLWDSRLVEAHLGRRKYNELLLEWLQSLGLTESQIHEIDHENKIQRLEVENTRMLFPGIMGMLEKLKKQGLKLVILSDTENSETKIRTVLEKLKINRYFDAVICSIDIGHVKPEKEAYQEALLRMGLVANEVAFVGHDEDEISGAERMGIGAIEIHPGDQNTKKGAIAEINKLAKVLIGN